MIELDYVRIPGSKTRIAMLPYPKTPDVLLGLKDWGAQGLLSLNRAEELARLGLANVGSDLARLGLWWGHLPITDQGIPDASFENKWAAYGPWLHARLDAGGSFAVHCWAGLGRTGLIVCRLLIERGIAVDEAISSVRVARPGTIETREQEDYLRGLCADDRL